MQVNLIPYCWLFDVLSNVILNVLYRYIFLDDTAPTSWSKKIKLAPQVWKCHYPQTHGKQNTKLGVWVPIALLIRLTKYCEVKKVTRHGIWDTPQYCDTFWGLSKSSCLQLINTTLRESDQQVSQLRALVTHTPSLVFCYSWLRGSRPIQTCGADFFRDLNVGVCF